MLRFDVVLCTSGGGDLLPFDVVLTWLLSRSSYPTFQMASKKQTMLSSFFKPKERADADNSNGSNDVAGGKLKKDVLTLSEYYDLFNGSYDI